MTDLWKIAELKVGEFFLIFNGEGEFANVDRYGRVGTLTLNGGPRFDLAAQNYYIEVKCRESTPNSIIKPYIEAMNSSFDENIEIVNLWQPKSIKQSTFLYNKVEVSLPKFVWITPYFHAKLLEYERGEIEQYPLFRIQEHTFDLPKWAWEAWVQINQVRLVRNMGSKRMFSALVFYINSNNIKIRRKTGRPAYNQIHCISVDRFYQLTEDSVYDER